MGESQPPPDGGRLEKASKTYRRGRAREQGKQAQLALTGIDPAPAKGFTVAEMLATLEVKSGGKFRQEGLLPSLAKMLAKQVSEIVRAGRKLEDIEVLGEYIGAGHLMHFPGGAPPVAILSHVGILEEFILESRRWTSTGRPSPAQWRRGRPQESRGYQPAPTDEALQNDPVLKHATPSDIGGWDLNPWALGQQAKAR